MSQQKSSSTQLRADQAFAKTSNSPTTATETRGTTISIATLASTTTTTLSTTSSSHVASSPATARLAPAAESLRGRRKTLDLDYSAVDFLDSEEPNNNTLFSPLSSRPPLPAPSSAHSALGGMDSRGTRKPDGQQSAGAFGGPGSAEPKTTGAVQVNLATSNTAVPSYPTLFNPTTNNSYRRAVSPQKVQSAKPVKSGAQPPLNKRNPLSKQLAADSMNGDSMNQSKRSLVTYKSTKLDDDDDDDDDSDDSNDTNEDELDEEEVDNGAYSADEQYPFRTGATKMRSADGKRIAPETQQAHNNSGKTPNGNSYRQHHGSKQRLHQQQQALRDHHHKKAHTKISFSENRPPSFNSCQANHNNGNLSAGRKLDWQHELATCYGCDCSSCHQRRKVAMAEGCRLSGGYGGKMGDYSKTRTIHLVLKSIVLLLCTLLLLMLLIGVILASHYLPEAFERVLNVSRSFNVTIAG